MTGTTLHTRWTTTGFACPFFELKEEIQKIRIHLSDSQTELEYLLRLNTRSWERVRFLRRNILILSQELDICILRIDLVPRNELP